MKVFVKLNPGSNPYIFCAIRQMRIIFSADRSFVIFMDQAYGLGQVLFTMNSLKNFFASSFQATITPFRGRGRQLTADEQEFNR